MTNRDIVLWYRALGLGPGRHDWRAVQNRYRKLVRQFHPDRLAPDSPQRAHAEERVREINVAYRALADQHKLRGELPLCPHSPDHDARRPIIPPRRPSSTPTSAPRPDDSRPAHDAMAKGADAASSRRKRAWAVPIAILVALGYLALTQLTDIADHWFSDDSSTGGAAVAPDTSKQSRAAPFTIGATLGQVHAAQGIPTSVDGDVWHYGLSTVQFADGRVQSWQEHPDHPLNVRLVPSGAYNIESSHRRNP
jgi:hypothetical protein